MRGTKSCAWGRAFTCVLCVLAVACVAASCEWLGVEGKEGEHTVRFSSNVAVFKFIGDYEVYYTLAKDSVYAATLIGVEEKLRNVEVEARADTLTIVDRARKKLGRVARRFKVVIEGPPPREFHLKGGRQLTAKDVGMGQSMSLSCEEFAGDVCVEGKFAWVGVWCYDCYGKIELGGEAKELYASMYGAQWLCARDLHTLRANVECGRMLGAEVNASDSLIVNFIEPCEVYYLGTPGVRIECTNGERGTVMPLRGVMGYVQR